MGLFGKKKQAHPLEGLTAYELQRGTQVPLVDVEPGFVEYVRSAKPRQPRIGHEAPIALVYRDGQVLAYYDDALVGRMADKWPPMYADEFAVLTRRRQFGATSVYIKPEGAKSPHTVAINWDEGCRDGGIL